MGGQGTRTAAALTLDAGALIAVDRGARDCTVLLQRARQAGLPISVPAGVVGQAWRDGRRQVRLARLLASPDVEVVTLDDGAARSAGQLCGATRTSDVIDASVVLCARSRGATVVTSDAGDLRRLDPRLALINL